MPSRAGKAAGGKKSGEIGTLSKIASFFAQKTVARE
jgi:hypothetical protein